MSGRVGLFGTKHKEKSVPVATRAHRLALAVADRRHARKIEPPQLAKDILVAGMANFRCPHCSQISLSVLGATALRWRLGGCSGVGGMQCKKVSIEMVEEREAAQVAEAKAAKD
jgi:hypothetical protein